MWCYKNLVFLLLMCELCGCNSTVSHVEYIVNIIEIESKKQFCTEKLFSNGDRYNPHNDLSVKVTYEYPEFYLDCGGEFSFKSEEFKGESSLIELNAIDKLKGGGLVNRWMKGSIEGIPDHVISLELITSYEEYQGEINTTHGCLPLIIRRIEVPMSGEISLGQWTCLGELTVPEDTGICKYLLAEVKQSNSK